MKEHHHAQGTDPRHPAAARRHDGEQSTPHAVQVGWDRVGYVQVGTVNLTNEQHTPEYGWFVDLDRRMVNDLIRLLRKARDAAYGRDE